MTETRADKFKEAFEAFGFSVDMRSDDRHADIKKDNVILRHMGRDYPIGNIIAHINYVRGSYDISVNPFPGGYANPHTSGGIVCLDTYGYAIRSALKEQRFIEAASYVDAACTSYNPHGAYRAIESCLICSNCDEEEFVDRACSVCGKEMCYNCSQSCETCGSYLCNDCATDMCDSGRHVLCANCTECKTCNREKYECSSCGNLSNIVIETKCDVCASRICERCRIEIDEKAYCKEHSVHGAIAGVAARRR